MNGSQDKKSQDKLRCRSSISGRGPKTEELLKTDHTLEVKHIKILQCPTNRMAETLQETSPELRHLSLPLCPAWLQQRLLKSLLVALRGRVDSRENTPHIRSGAFQSHFYNSVYFSILA